MHSLRQCFLRRKKGAEWEILLRMGILFAAVRCRGWPPKDGLWEITRVRSRSSICTQQLLVVYMRARSIHIYTIYVYIHTLAAKPFFFFFLIFSIYLYFFFLVRCGFLLGESLFYSIYTNQTIAFFIEFYDKQTVGDVCYEYRAYNSAIFKIFIRCSYL